MRGFVTEKRVIDCVVGMVAQGQRYDIVAVRWRPTAIPMIECDLVLSLEGCCVFVETKSHLRSADVVRLSRRFMECGEQIMQDRLIAGRATSYQIVCACETYSDRAVSLCQECGYGLFVVDGSGAGAWIVGVL